MPLSDRSPHPRARPLVLLLLVLLLSIAVRAFAGEVLLERYYSRGLYTVLRPAYDHSIGLLPFPAFFLFWLGLVAWIGWQVLRWRQRGNELLPRRRKWLGLLRASAALIMTLIIAFLWMWGMNYGRQSVEKRMSFATYQPPLPELRERVYRTAEELAELRARITSDTAALTATDLPNDLEGAIRPLVAGAMIAHAYPAPGRPRGWRLRPKGILLYLGTAGVYWPWATQGNIDAGLHPLQQSAVLAHELSHAYGFGDEGTCSFWAYLAAAQTRDPRLAYTLQLAYWRQIAGLLRYADPEAYLAWRESTLDAGIKNDLAAIYANGALYEEVAPALRDATYTAYLHAQGIDDGLLNYGRVVQLVEGYRRNYGNSR